jgi:hypothetical protein
VDELFPAVRQDFHQRRHGRCDNPHQDLIVIHTGYIVNKKTPVKRKNEGIAKVGILAGWPTAGSKSVIKAIDYGFGKIKPGAFGFRSCLERWRLI